jgi:NhaP-type Na+/H+ or K+/H+ antiporter
LRCSRSALLTIKAAGVGSIYYLAYGINHMEVDNAERRRGIVGLVVLFSVLFHGLTVTPIMRSLDKRRGVDQDADATPPPELQGPADQVTAKG